MNLIIVIVVITVLSIFIFNYFIDRQKRVTYLKAGKKWDGIVKELSRRK